MKNNITFSLSLLALSCLQANAAPTTTTPPTAVTTAGTDYTAFVGASFIDLGEALFPMTMGDMLMCIVTASGAPLLPTETYNAVVDFGLCGAAAPNQTTYSSMVVESSRASDVAPQNVNIWMEYKQDASTAAIDVHMKVKISAEPTATNHLGVWQIDWEFQNPGGDNTINNGHIKSVAGTDGLAEYTMASQSKHDGEDSLIYGFAKMAMTSLTEGHGRVTNTHEDPDENYTLAFNDSFVAVKEGTDPATCQNLQSFTDKVYNYNLYDSSGTLVDIKSQIEFKTAAGYAGGLGSYSYWDSGSRSEETKYWVWMRDGGYPTSSIPTTVSDRDTPTTKYTITWDVQGAGSAATHKVTAVADGLTSVGSGGSAHVFDNPIIFDISSDEELATTISPLTERNDSTSTLTAVEDFWGQLEYAGPGDLYGFEFNYFTNYYKASLADGTALISKDTSVNDLAHRGQTYYVKAAEVARVPVSVSTDNCAVLSGPMATAAAIGLPTQADITNNSPSLGTKPVVTAEPKIKDGVLITD